MEGRTVAMLARESENTIKRIEWEFTLTFGYVVVLNEGRYELFQLEQ